MALPHRLGSDEPQEILTLDEATRQFIREHLNADVPTLALQKAPVGTDVSLALRQIEARQMLKKKAPTWGDNDDLLFPPHLSIEQSSSEATARYKAKLLKGHTLADLTGGLGIDTYYLSQNFRQTDYVERQSLLCDLARHNFAVLGARIVVWNETAEEYINHCNPKDCIYLDPARRASQGRKVVAIGDCEPNVAALQDLLLQKAPTLLVKLSPMLDLSQALAELRCVSEVHVVAVANECKELVFKIERGFSGEASIHCANLLTRQPELRFSRQEERDCTIGYADRIGTYLYEPNAALLKAGCFKLAALRHGLQKLHKNSHLYTSDKLVPDFPGRIFEVVSWAAFNKKTRRGLLADLKQANLAVRNFPMAAAEMRKTLGLADGGDVYLFATTLHDGAKVLVRTKKAVR